MVLIGSDQGSGVMQTGWKRYAKGNILVRIRPPVVLACLAFVVIAAATIFFWRSYRNVSKMASTSETISTPPRRAPKPSPAVPLEENSSRAKSSVSESGSEKMTPSKQWPADGMQMTAHHKGRHGCKGMLTLKASGLQFTCPEDDRKSFFVPLNDIRGQDEDGIVTNGGSKYHFDMLPGGEREYAEQLFAAWLSPVRAAQPPAGARK